MKKQHKSSNSQWINYVVSLCGVLLIGSVLILIQGSSPLEAFGAIVSGSLGSISAISSSIRWSIPVLIATMAAIIAQKPGIINLGLEGQIYFAAFSAGLVGALVPLPRIIHIPFTILVGGIVGLIYAILPALLKVYLKIDEMVSTLMMNYIAVFATELLTMNLSGLNATSNPDMIATPEILDSAKLPQLFKPYQASAGIFIAIGIVFIVHIIYKYTRTGYEWEQLGRNSRFARYGGIRDKKNYITVFLLSGFVAGICGAVEIIGAHYRFRNNFASNLGWDGIMVALIAKNNPMVALVVGVIWGMIKAGSLSMERMTNVNRILVTLIQALFVLFVTVDIKALVKKVINKQKRKRQLGGEAV